MVWMSWGGCTDLGPAQFRTTAMTIPYYVNEHTSDIRAIKPGWYGMESGRQALVRAVSKRGEMPHWDHSREGQVSSIALVGAGHREEQFSSIALVADIKCPECGTSTSAVHSLR